MPTLSSFPNLRTPLLVGLAGIVAAISSPRAAPAQELAVVSRSENVVVLHDAETAGELARVPVGNGTHEVVLDAAREHAFVASYGGNTVHVIDLHSREARTITLAGHSSLHGIAASASGDLVWVTAEDAGAVLEIDTRHGEIVRTWPTQGEQSHMVVVTPDGRKLYVANIVSGTVTAIDRETEVTRVIETGAGAEGIDVSPDGAEVWVSNRADNTISVIDTETDRVVAEFGTGGEFAVKVRMRPDGREVWVANNQSQTVTVFDRERRTLVATIPVGVRPLGIGFSADSRRAFVTRPGDNEVVEIDVERRSIVRRFPTGGSPDGVVWIGR